MRKRHLIKLQRQQVVQRHWILRLRILRRVHDVLEVLQRHFRLAIRPDNRPQLLERPEDKEGIEEQREIRSHRNLMAEDQVKQKKEQRRPQCVDDGALNETQAAQVAYFPQLQLENLAGRVVEPRDFLLRQA